MGIWYAFRVPPQKEFVAKEIMRRRGYNAIVPIEIKQCRPNRYAKRKEPKEYPMLLGYLFIEVPQRVPWYDLFRYRIVQGVVGMGGRPTTIPEAAIGSLMEKSGTDIPHVYAKNTRTSFGVGDDVVVTHGPFCGFEGKVEKIKGAKARAVFNGLGIVDSIDIPLDMLRAA